MPALRTFRTPPLSALSRLLSSPLLSSPLLRFSRSALAAAGLSAALLFCPASSFALPEASPAGLAAASPETPALSEPSGYEPLESLKFRTPATFAELGPESPLFRDTQAHALRAGRLLKLYLPQHMARQYLGGRPDAVTRQVLVCGLEEQTRPLDAKDAELLARSAEGFFIGFSRIPRSATDTPAQEEQNRAEALRASLATGRPLLVDSQRTSSAYLHTCLIHFAMGEKKSGVFLPCALASAVVPVNDTVLFVTVSSLLGQDEAEPHLEWVKETASAFAEALVKANRKEKD